MAAPAGPASPTTQPRSPWYRYGVAAATVSVAATANLAVHRYLPDVSPVVLFPTAVVVAAAFGGVWAGLLATLLAGLLRLFVLDMIVWPEGGPAAGLRISLALVEGAVLSVVASGAGDGVLSRDRASLSRYGLAVIVIAVVLAAKLVLLDDISRAYPFLFLYAAVAVTARAGGLGPGLVAAALAAGAVGWFWLYPLSAVSPSQAALPKVLLFGTEAVLITLVCSRRLPVVEPER